MANRRYLNFDLLLEQEGEGEYRARVVASPLGDTPSVEFRLPFDATGLELLLLKLDPGRTGVRGSGSAQQQQAARAFGGPLFDAIFTGDVMSAWTRSLDRVRAADDSGLRLRLRLDDAPAIAGLPWELLYDAKNRAFPAQSERTPLVRFLDVAEAPRPIGVDGPLRVLAIISSPIGLEELDTDAEWNRIKRALATKIEERLVVIDRLPEPTVNALGKWLHNHQTHIIHFVGHGDFDQTTAEGFIYFQNARGEKAAVGAATLGPFVHDHDALRMVVLNACRSASTSGVDPFGGMAQGLVQQDATAVVAMQFPITDTAAVMFTGEFYGALADGLPVDQAVSSARKALLADFPYEWATPVLFMRSPDGNIFENVHAPLKAPGPPPPPPPPDEPEPEEPHPGPPGPPPDPDPDPDEVGLLAWARAHVPVVAGVGLVLAALVVAVVLVLTSDGGGPEEKVDPVTLPTSAPLKDGQLIVAAGNKYADLHVWFADPAHPANSRNVSKGKTLEWLPVVSPNGQTLVFSRRIADSDNYVLWTAGLNGTNPRPLFDQGPPDECAVSTGRPAWIAGKDELVLKCKDDGGEFSLVRVDVHGKWLQTYDVVDQAGNPLLSYGDVTVSFDGRTMVLFASATEDAQDGSLYAIDVQSGLATEILPAVDGVVNYSDAAFSPVDNTLAYRANLVDDDSGAGFEVFVATLTDGITLGTPDNISGMVEGRDQDPIFSPDGTQVVYGHMPDDQTPPTQVLMIANRAAPHEPIELVLDRVMPFRAVPAWGRR